MILVDTNIFVEFYKNNPVVCAVLDSIDPQKIAVNDVVRAELYFGARNKQELSALASDMEQLTALTIYPQISQHATELVKQYCLSHKLKLPDTLIAATALYHNVELLTLNTKDFSYIPHLKLYEKS
jgi:predicted nucleic acid-binding protein